MGLETGCEGYGGKERWMNEVGIKKWVWKTRERKGGGMDKVVWATAEKHEHGREEELCEREGWQGSELDGYGGFG